VIKIVDSFVSMVVDNTGRRSKCLFDKIHVQLLMAGIGWIVKVVLWKFHTKKVFIVVSEIIKKVKSCRLIYDSVNLILRIKIILDGVNFPKICP
jgi:hypothetical protein